MVKAVQAMKGINFVKVSEKYAKAKGLREEAKVNLNIAQNQGFVQTNHVANHAK